MSISTKQKQSDSMSGGRTAQWNTSETLTAGVWLCVGDGIGGKKTHSSLDISAVRALIPRNKKCTHRFHDFKHCPVSPSPQLISDRRVWAEGRLFLRNTRALRVTAAFARLTTALGHPCPRGPVTPMRCDSARQTDTHTHTLNHASISFIDPPCGARHQSSDRPTHPDANVVGGSGKVMMKISAGHSVDAHTSSFVVFLQFSLCVF